MLKSIYRKNILEIIFLREVCKQYGIYIYEQYNLNLNDEVFCDPELIIKKYSSVSLFNVKRNFVNGDGSIFPYNCYSIIESIKLIKKTKWKINATII